MFTNFYLMVCFLLSLSLGQETNKSTQCTLTSLPKQVKIVIFVNEPYVMKKIEGNMIIYYGFAIDLVDLIMRDLEVTYEFYEVPDGTYGKLINDTWTGMIGEIISGKADLAVGDLQITAEREAAVDFSIPFMDTGISILLKNQKNPDGTLRVTCTNDLLSQRFEFGTLAFGSARKFLRMAEDKRLKNISQAMESNPENFARSDDEGVKRVKKGMYAYFMDEAKIEYLVAQNCDFIQVGGLFNKIVYGFGMKRDSSLRKAINQILLKLEESLRLMKLKESWKRYKGADCPSRIIKTSC